MPNFKFSNFVKKNTFDIFPQKEWLGWWISSEVIQYYRQIINIDASGKMLKPKLIISTICQKYIYAIMQNPELISKSLPRVIIIHSGKGSTLTIRSNTNAGHFFRCHIWRLFKNVFLYFQETDCLVGKCFIQKYGCSILKRNRYKAKWWSTFFYQNWSIFF